MVHFAVFIANFLGQDRSFRVIGLTQWIGVISTLFRPYRSEIVENEELTALKNGSVPHSIRTVPWMRLFKSKSATMNNGSIRALPLLTAGHTSGSDLALSYDVKSLDEDTPYLLPSAQEGALAMPPLAIYIVYSPPFHDLKGTFGTALCCRHNGMRE